DGEGPGLADRSGEQKRLGESRNLLPDGADVSYESTERACGRGRESGACHCLDEAVAAGTGLQGRDDPERVAEDRAHDLLSRVEDQARRGLRGKGVESFDTRLGAEAARFGGLPRRPYPGHVERQLRSGLEGDAERLKRVPRSSEGGCRIIVGGDAVLRNRG